MAKTFLQFVAAAAGPLLTLGATALVLRYVAVTEDTADALGAALASAAGFALVQGYVALPKKSAWWRQRFDRRAAYEGVWLQLHEDEPGRIAVFSFSYDGDGDEYHVRGDAFDAAGAHLADWKSTRVFFSAGEKEVSYLWTGKARGGERQGTSTMSLDPGARGVRPQSGTGTVLHLMEDRRLDFRLQRVTDADLARLGRSFSVAEAQASFDRRRELAVAWAAENGIRADAGTTSALG